MKSDRGLLFGGIIGGGHLARPEAKPHHNAGHKLTPDLRIRAPDVHYDADPGLDGRIRLRVRRLVLADKWVCMG